MQVGLHSVEPAKFWLSCLCQSGLNDFQWAEEAQSLFFRPLLAVDRSGFCLLPQKLGHRKDRKDRLDFWKCGMSLSHGSHWLEDIH